MSEENIHLRLYSVEYKFKNTYSCIDAAEADDRALSFPQLDMRHPLSTCVIKMGKPSRGCMAAKP